jgi:MFS family permease
VCIGLSNFFWLPVMGSVSDKIGRKPLLLAATILAILTAYPALSWLVANPSFSHLLIVELWLSFLYGSYNGAMVVALTEIMPVEVRTPASPWPTAWRRRPSAVLPRRPVLT